MRTGKTSAVCNAPGPGPSHIESIPDKGSLTNSIKYNVIMVTLNKQGTERMHSACTVLALCVAQRESSLGASPVNKAFRCESQENCSSVSLGHEDMFAISINIYTETRN